MRVGLNQRLNGYFTTRSSSETFPFLDELHHGDGGHCLRDRGDLDEVVRRHGDLGFEVGMTVGAFQGDTVITDHGHLKAGEAEEEPQPFDLSLEVLDPRGRICRRAIGRPRCSDERSQQPEEGGELRNQPPENHPYVARTGIRFIQVNHS
jgi:hypothetical protein